MAPRHVRLAAAPPDRVRQALDELLAELEIPLTFSSAALAEAEHAAAGPPPAHADRTDLAVVTIDPPGSRDLDQAVHLARADDGGFVVHYAIADVASFVVPGGALDRSVHERGVTVYGPTGSVPLHPEVLSAGAASLLPDEVRPACLWRIVLDADGAIRDASVSRALVRSRAQLTYAQVQAVLDGGADPAVPAELPDLLREVGTARQRKESERGGMSLDIPEQSVIPANGGYELELRATLPVEGWNAQISLLTGIAAAAIMREYGTGVLRTLPDADPRDVARLRRTAEALGIDWPGGRSYGELIRALDAAVPAHAAFLNEATSLFRGADYHAFGAGIEDEQQSGTRHAAIAAEYAHVTAPLRRLVDRYGLEVCLAACAGTAVPEWVLEALPGLPRTMARTTQRASRFENGAVDTVEALVLEGSVGEMFEAVVIEVEDHGRADGGAASDGAPGRSGGADGNGNGSADGLGRGTVMLTAPPVEGRVRGRDLPLGERVRVRLVEVDVVRRRIDFELVRA
ncbi:RNB domain-containing ribonuclease [Georgenia wangjunii]|uniref:RNB domain-containing ribonuclease n=1 Tax=Georgenia wangjunii TaxID=3117730 RepID=UPI002F2615C0